MILVFATNLPILCASKQQYARVDMHMPIIISVLYCHIGRSEQCHLGGNGKIMAEANNDIKKELEQMKP